MRGLCALSPVEPLPPDAAFQEPGTLEEGPACGRAGDAPGDPADWPIFRGLRTTVISVSDVAVPWSAGMAPGLYDQVMESYVESVQEARREVAALVSTSADRLSDAGLLTSVDVRDGDPAATLVKAAAEHGSDLIVMGTRGLTGLSRILLGSVARNVLVHAPCSVLIVREHTFEPHREAAAAGVGTGAAR